MDRTCFIVVSFVIILFGQGTKARWVDDGKKPGEHLYEKRKVWQKKVESYNRIYSSE